MDNVLVIGGAAGIGREIALDFAKKGHQVAVADIDRTTLNTMIQQSSLEQNLHAFNVDVSSWESVSAMVRQVIEKFRHIHTLVFSAGITKRLGLEEVDWALWKKTLAINLHGLFYSIKAMSPYMMVKKEGSIVIIGSGSAITGSGGGIQYYASKGGAFGLMRSLVKELGSYGINVNVVAPRVIQSQMLDTLYPTVESKQAIINEIPIGRLGKCSDISGLVQYVSAKHAKYIHGQILVLDGGRTYQGK